MRNEYRHEQTLVRSAMLQQASVTSINTVRRVSEIVSDKLQCIELTYDESDGWIPNYESMMEATPVAGMNLREYVVFCGPGDHVGTDLVTQKPGEEDPPVPTGKIVTSAAAKFAGDPTAHPVLVPVEADMYIELASGADKGRHKIKQVVDANTLELETALTADATGIAYRISIVNNSSPTITLVSSGGTIAAKPDIDTIELKIYKAIVEESDYTGDPYETKLAELYAQQPYAFFACFRVKPPDGTIDLSRLFAVRPWRGHGAIEFKKEDGSQIYTLNAADPVFHAALTDGVWRLIFGVAQAWTVQPENDALCPNPE